MLVVLDVGSPLLTDNVLSTMKQAARYVLSSLSEHDKVQYGIYDRSYQLIEMCVSSQVSIVAVSDRVLAPVSGTCLRSFAFNTRQVRAELSSFLEELVPASSKSC